MLVRWVDVGPGLSALGGGMVVGDRRGAWCWHREERGRRRWCLGRRGRQILPNHPSAVQQCADPAAGPGRPLARAVPRALLLPPLGNASVLRKSFCRLRGHGEAVETVALLLGNTVADPIGPDQV